MRPNKPQSKSQQDELHNLIRTFQAKTLVVTPPESYLELADNYEAQLQSYIDKAVKEARKARVEKNESFCGCPMCDYHTSAWALKRGDKTL